MLHRFLLVVAIFLFGAGYWLYQRSSVQSAVHLVELKGDKGPVRAVLLIPHDNPLLAHYTEHLAWLPNIGAGSRPEDRHTDAWTDDYSIGYWLSGPPEALPDILRRLKSVFSPIGLPRTFAEQERAILSREYDLRVANTIDAKAAIEMEAFLYDGNPIAGDPIGTPQTIRALTYDDAKALHAATHRPERARLVVIGDVSEGRLAKALQQAGFPDLDAKREERGPPPFILAAPETRVFRYPAPEAAPRMTLRRVVTLPSPTDFDVLAAQTALARDILDTNLPGGIAGPLRFDRFVTKSFALSIAPIDERHVELIFAAEPDKGIGFATMQAAFEAALTASATGVPQTTYDRVRVRFKGYWPDWSDETATGDWMAQYSLSRLSALREPKSERALRTIDAQIRPDSIRALISALTGPGRTAIAFIGTDPKP